MKTIIEMAREAGGGLSCVAEPLEHPWKFSQSELERFAALVFEQGRQEGMKQERALWELSKLGQEIEAQSEQGTWQGLTKEEIDSALSKYQNWYDFAAHLENILKEKNQ